MFWKYLLPCVWLTQIFRSSELYLLIGRCRRLNCSTAARSHRLQLSAVRALFGSRVLNPSEIQSPDNEGWSLDIIILFPPPHPFLLVPASMHHCRQHNPQEKVSEKFEMLTRCYDICISILGAHFIFIFRNSCYLFLHPAALGCAAVRRSGQLGRVHITFSPTFY